MKQSSIIGKTFNQLTFIKFLKRDYQGHLLYKFHCDCGDTYIGRKSGVISGNTKSCGCRLINKARLRGLASKTHGLSGTRFQQIYYGIQRRCYDINSQKYLRYGKRGIKCEWKSFVEFWQVMYKSYLEHSERFGEKSTFIERINNDGNYSKENCRWATMKEQLRNTSRNHWITYQGKTLCLQDWAKEIGISIKSLTSRINQYRWSIKKALTTPIRHSS